MRTIAVVSDLQVPFHSPRAVRTLAAFIKAYKPDSVACVGDVLDSPQVSRWTKGLAGEYTKDLAKHRDAAVRILEDLQVKDLSRSNHDDRVEIYLQKYAPGLDGLPELRTETFLRLDDLGIVFHRRPYELAPGWLLMHGDEGGLSRTPGGTALSLARSTGKSVVAGHTHKLGLQHESRGYNGKSNTIWGFEVGNLMELGKAEYLKFGGANWSQGFGLLFVEGSKVTPSPIPIDRDGSFVVDGRRWTS